MTGMPPDTFVGVFHCGCVFQGRMHALTPSYRILVACQPAHEPPARCESCQRFVPRGARICLDCHSVHCPEDASCDCADHGPISLGAFA